MILLTMGTTDMKFDRLVKAIDIAVGENIFSEDVFAQIGCARYIPKNMEYKRLLDKIQFDELFEKASFIIGHAGMGTITMALEASKPALLVPRLAEYNEHVNDHQLQTAKKFEELGHIICLYDPFDLEELQRKIKQAFNFIPKERIVSPENIAVDVLSYINTIH